MSQQGNPKIISRFNLEKEELSQSPGGKNYLLAIAIDEYEHCPRLYRAVADAQELIAVLTDKYLFEKENSTTLFNREATDRNIQRAFRELVDKVTENDSLVIFYSGHGWFDEKMRTGYWIPVEAAMGDSYDYISNSIIFDYLDAIRARHIFMVADSCFSGSLFGATKNVGTSERLERDPSRWCLTAGRNEIVVEHGEGSPFTQSLIYQLKANS
ncbi:MAG: caspase family protein, partial [Bacteroidota bacterium]